MNLTPGSHLDRYEILELFGKGGMGEVYRAKDTKLPREVAIKSSAQQLGVLGATHLAQADEFQDLVAIHMAAGGEAHMGIYSTLA